METYKDSLDFLTPLVNNSISNSLPSSNTTVCQFPHVTLSFAQTLDGYISHTSKTPIKISSPPSFIMTHTLRSLHDGILVGIETILSDDPRLTLRLNGILESSPSSVKSRPIILDSRLRFPLESKCLKEYKDGRGGKPWIFTTHVGEATGRIPVLEEAGIQVNVVDGDNEGKISISAMLKVLGNQNLKKLMVEGGSRIIHSFLTSKYNDLPLTNLVIITIAPTFLGDGVKVLSSGGKHSNLPRFTNVKYHQFGPDIVMAGNIAT